MDNVALTLSLDNIIGRMYNILKDEEMEHDANKKKILSDLKSSFVNEMQRINKTPEVQINEKETQENMDFLLTKFLKKAEKSQKP